MPVELTSLTVIEPAVEHSDFSLYFILSLLLIRLMLLLMLVLVLLALLLLVDAGDDGDNAGSNTVVNGSCSSGVVLVLVLVVLVDMTLEGRSTYLSSVSASTNSCLRNSNTVLRPLSHPC